MCAFDASEERLAALREAILERGIANIEAFVGNATEQISVDDNRIDVCLTANVFHEPLENGAVEGELRGIKRVLKRSGILALAHFKKDVVPPIGPLSSVRLTPEEVDGIFSQYGFKRERSIDIDPYHYLVFFTLAPEEDDHARI